MYDDNDLSGDAIFDEDGADLKAGFIQSRSGYSQSQMSQYGPRLLPVTALMLSRVEQDPEDANRLTLDGLEVSTVSLAGIAVGLNSQSTYTTILLNDGTDLVEVQRWNKKINEGEMDSEDDIAREGMSVYVFGSLRMFNKSVSLSAQKVRPLAGLDEMSSHIAYVIYSYLRLKLRQEGSEDNIVYHNVGSLPSGDSNVDINQRVLDSLKLFSDFAQGVKRNKIYSMLKNYASEEQINTSINTLIREGLAYVTINYDYVKAL